MSVNLAAPPRTSRGWTILIVLGAVLSAVGWMRIRFDSSLEPLLPEGSAARQTIIFLRDSSFANKAVLWLRLKSGGKIEDLFAAADATEKRLDPHLIQDVVHAPAEAGAVDEMFSLGDRAGELLNSSDLAQIEDQLSPGALRQRMRDCYLQLIEPQSSFTTSMIRRDPLGVGPKILSRLSALQKGIGYDVEIHDGRFVHPDGRQLLLILQTSATATSLASSESVARHFDWLAAQMPADVELIPICPQIHTEQNDVLMQRDMRIAAIVNTLAFILIFFLVSRDLRVGAVFLLPLATTALAIGWCGLFYRDFSTMMIGLAVTMAGSAVDYGIYVYTAVTLGRHFQSDIKRVRKPLVISHLTTLAVFFAFLFSGIPAYRQLGCLTCVSLITCLLAALFLLPKVIKPGGSLTFLGRGMSLSRWGGMMVVPTIAMALVFVAAVVVASRIRFDPDITRLDGVSQRVRDNEDDFQRTWGRTDKPMAMLVVAAKTQEQAEEASDRLFSQLQAHFAPGEFVSLSSFWPSMETRAANLARWRAFWNPQRVAEFRKNLTAAGNSYGFSANAFAPFFAGLSRPPSLSYTPSIVKTLQNQFSARTRNGEYQVLSYFDDSQANIAFVRSITGDDPDAQLISRGLLAEGFAESAASETKTLVGISLAFIVLSLVIMTRNLRQSVLIMLPAAAGLAAMLAVLVLAHQGMSIVSVVASILILALGSDYGVFASYAWDGGEPVLGQGMSSVLLSCFATCAGTAAMLFAQHPALWLVGLTLTSGLVAAYLTAVVMIPGIEWIMDRDRRRG